MCIRVPNILRVYPEVQVVFQEESTLVSALTAEDLGPMYHLVFEITDGPTFHRIADAAKYYHDPEVNMPLYFSGTLTDTRTGRSRKVRLRAAAWGFYSGRGYEKGDMVVYLSFANYFIRGSGQVSYNWRHKKAERSLELAPIAKKKEKSL